MNKRHQDGANPIQGCNVSGVIALSTKEKNEMSHLLYF
jgi:hypothetical protein